MSERGKTLFVIIYTEDIDRKEYPVFSVSSGEIACEIAKALSEKTYKEFRAEELPFLSQDDTCEKG